MSEKTSKGTSVNGAPTKSNDFVGRGGATEWADFGTFCPEEAERSPRRRVPKSKFQLFTPLFHTELGLRRLFLLAFLPEF